MLLSTGWAEIAIGMLLCSHIPDLRGGANVWAYHGYLHGYLLHGYLSESITPVKCSAQEGEQ